MPKIPFFLSAPHLRALLALALAVALVASKSEAAAPGPFRNFLGQWTGKGQVVGSNGHQEFDSLPGAIFGDERRRGAQSDDRVRQRKLQAEHQELCRSLRRVGYRLLERSRPRPVGACHGTHRGEPIRGRVQRSDFHRRNLADLHRPNPGRQHQAQRRRHRRGAHRTSAAGVSDRPPSPAKRESIRRRSRRGERRGKRFSCRRIPSSGASRRLLPQAGEGNAASQSSLSPSISVARPRSSL